MINGKTISVVIPAFNEEKSIGKVVSGIPDYVDHIVVIDDGSTDQTAAIARAKGVLVVSHDKNGGLGVAFRTGLRKSLELNADIMVTIDADGQFNSGDIGKLIEPIFGDRADFVTASRFKDPLFYPDMAPLKFWGNKVLAFIISKMIGRRFYDVTCGFRAYADEALLKLNLFGTFTYTQETFLDLAFKNARIAEIPIKIKGSRADGTSKVTASLANYIYQAGIIILRTLRDYKVFRFFAAISLLFFLASLAFGIFTFVHFARTGFFSPYKWVGFVSAFCLAFAAISFLAGFVADMLVRIRYNQEETLYFIKKIVFKKR